MNDRETETPLSGAPSSRRRCRASGIRFAAATAITIVLMGFVFHLTSPSELIETVSATSPSLMLLSLLLVGIMYGVRAVKYRLALGDSSVSHRDWWAIVAVYSMLKNSVPFRIGEFSLPAMLARKYGVSAGRSLLVLYVGLASDLVSLLFLGGLAVAGTAWSTSSVVLERTTWAAALLFVTGLFFYYRAEWLPRFVHRRLGGRFTGRGVRRFLRWLDAVAGALGSYSRSRLTTFLGLSAITWVLRFWILALLLPSWGVDLSFIEVSTASTIMSLFNALPIQGLAGFGTMETGWALAFTLFGLPLDTAVRSSFAVHVAIIVLMLFHFIIGLILYANIRARAGTSGAVAPIPADGGGL